MGFSCFFLHTANYAAAKCYHSVYQAVPACWQVIGTVSALNIHRLHNYVDGIDFQEFLPLTIARYKQVYWQLIQFSLFHFVCL